MSGNSVANSVTLAGDITTIETLRHTPAGLPIVGFTLAHRSAQVEAGVSRQTAFEVAALAMGEAAVAATKYQSGDVVAVKGFLSAKSRKGVQLGTQLVLHVTHIEKTN